MLLVMFFILAIGLVIGPRPAVINLDLLALILSNLSIQYTNISRIGPIPVRPITARSESARRFDNGKEKSREMSVVC